MGNKFEDRHIWSSPITSISSFQLDQLIFCEDSSNTEFGLALIFHIEFQLNWLSIFFFYIRNAFSTIAFCSLCPHRTHLSLLCFRFCRFFSLAIFLLVLFFSSHISFVWLIYISCATVASFAVCLCVFFRMCCASM